MSIFKRIFKSLWQTVQSSLEVAWFINVALGRLRPTISWLSPPPTFFWVLSGGAIAVFRSNFAASCQWEASLSFEMLFLWATFLSFADCGLRPISWRTAAVTLLPQITALKVKKLGATCHSSQPRWRELISKMTPGYERLLPSSGPESCEEIKARQRKRIYKTDHAWDMMLKTYF